MGPHILQARSPVVEQLLSSVGDRGDGRHTAFLRLGQGQLAGLIEDCPLFLEVAGGGANRRARRSGLRHCRNWPEATMASAAPRSSPWVVRQVATAKGRG